VTVYTFAASVFDNHQTFPLVAFLALDLLNVSTEKGAIFCVFIQQGGV